MPKTPWCPLRPDNIFTTEEKQLIKAAEASFMTLTRSFEAWTDIGWAVLAVDDAVARMDLKTLRARQTAFYDLLAATKLRSIVNRQQRSLLSKLRAIMGRLDEVAAWRATLTANQRIAWAGPLSVWLNCPAFHPPRKPVVERPPTVRASLAVIREENEQLRARVAELQEERGGGPAETVTPVALAYLMELESADEIVGAMETLLEEQPGKLREITQRMAAKTGTQAPTVAAEADEHDHDGHDDQDVSVRLHGQSDCGDATRSGIVERMIELADDPQQMMAVALQHLADEEITDVPELLGHLCQKFGVKVDAKTGTVALPKKKAKRSSTKTVQQTGKLGEVVSEAFGEFRELAEEVREVVDNGDRFAGTQRIQTLEETADALEGIDRPEVPDAIKDLPVTYNEVQSTRKDRGLSRANSCAVAVEMLRAAAKVVEGSEDDEVVEFRDAIEEAAQTADACEFPGW
jgi:hypothetical protein